MHVLVQESDKKNPSDHLEKARFHRFFCSSNYDEKPSESEQIECVKNKEVDIGSFFSAKYHVKNEDESQRCIARYTSTTLVRT